MTVARARIAAMAGRKDTMDKARGTQGSRPRKYVLSRSCSVNSVSDQDRICIPYLKHFLCV